MFVEGGLHPEQIKALRKMTSAQRLKIGLEFMEEMRQLKAASLRAAHPNWSEEQIASSLRDFVLNVAS
jgi:hypothetical protein